jgi:AAA15 family ATPase/GTPase
LQRIIFYKTAIASNHDAVLLFEEPEAHSFPPYISEITQDMIDKKDSQFFISTHSPYILNELLEDAKDELAVFLLDYKDYQTVVNRLSEAELHQIYQDGVDLFMNNESYL